MTDTSDDKTGEPRKVRVITFRVEEMATRIPVRDKWVDPLFNTNQLDLYQGEFNMEIEEGETVEYFTMASPPGKTGHAQVQTPEGVINVKTKIVVAQVVFAKEQEILVHATEAEAEAARQDDQARSLTAGEAASASGENGSAAEDRGSTEDDPGRKAGS